MASAITGKCVSTSSDATFETMATNIKNISTGKYPTVLATTLRSNVQRVTSYNIVDTNFVTAQSTSGMYTVKKVENID